MSIEQHGPMESSSSSRDSTSMRGHSLSKKYCVPFKVRPCHLRSSPSNMSAANSATIFPLKRLSASLKPVSYLRKGQIRVNVQQQLNKEEARKWAKVRDATSTVRTDIIQRSIPDAAYAWDRELECPTTEGRSQLACHVQSRP